MGPGDRLALPGDELGKAIGPAGRDPVRRGGVDHARRIVAHRFDQMRRLLRRLIRQAEDDDINVCIELPLGLGILTRRGGQAGEHNARQAREPFADLQAGGACFAVNEDCRHCRLSKVPRSSEAQSRIREARAFQLRRRGRMGDEAIMGGIPSIARHGQEIGKDPRRTPTATDVAVGRDLHPLRSLLGRRNFSRLHIDLQPNGSIDICATRQT